MIRSSLIAVVFALCGMAGCRNDPPPATVPPAAVPSPAAPLQVASDAAAKLDTRTPLPLLPMMAEHQKQQMRNHLAAVQEILAALAHQDFEGVNTATKKIGYSEPMAQMCNHMGAGEPGFTPMALAFHRAADKIGDAAKKKDREAVISALSATLSTCVGCHATYKQQIVDEAAWSKLTATSPPTGDPAMHHQ